MRLKFKWSKYLHVSSIHLVNNNRLHIEIFKLTFWLTIDSQLSSLHPFGIQRYGCLENLDMIWVSKSKTLLFKTAIGTARLKWCMSLSSGNYILVGGMEAASHTFGSQIDVKWWVVNLLWVKMLVWISLFGVCCYSPDVWMIHEDILIIWISTDSI